MSSTNDANAEGLELDLGIYEEFFNVPIEDEAAPGKGLANLIVGDPPMTPTQSETSLETLVDIHEEPPVGDQTSCFEPIVVIDMNKEKSELENVNVLLSDHQTCTDDVKTLEPTGEDPSSVDPTKKIINRLRKPKKCVTLNKKPTPKKNSKPLKKKKRKMKETKMKTKKTSKVVERLLEWDFEDESEEETSPPIITKSGAKKSRTYVCQKRGCGKAFTRSYHLARHCRSHEDVKPYQCELCGQGFVQQVDLTRHASVHSHGKPHECIECHRGFVSQKSLTEHIKLVHEMIGDYPCNECGKIFRGPAPLAKHITAHGNIRPYQCKFCEARFKLPYHCSRHMKTVHGKIDLPKTSPQPISESEEAVFNGTAAVIHG